MPMPSVFVIGGVSFDHLLYLDTFPEPAPQTLGARRSHETIGSTGAGKALNLCRLGFRVTLHGLLGDDDGGRRVRERLAGEPLEFLHDPDPLGTPRHVNLMDAAGRRISIFAVAGSFEPELDLGRLTVRLADCDYLVLNIINYARRLIPHARSAGKAVWCDIHDYDGYNPYHRDFIEAADYLFLSSEALPDWRGFMEARVRQGTRLVVCTHGSRGATALTGQGQWLETPAVTGYGHVDSNGAGDAFFAGFLYGHAQGYATVRCLRLAAITAALCVASQELFHPGLSPDTVAAAYRQPIDGRLPDR